MNGIGRIARIGIGGIGSGVLALLLVVGLQGEASAQAAITNPNALGAAIALPYLTTTSGGDRVTVHTVTNSSTMTAYTLHAIWLSGDNGDEWAALDFKCPLTPLETTYFVYENNGNGTANVTFECSNLGVTTPLPGATNNVFTRQIPGEDGILFVALECQIGAAGCPAGGAFALRTRSNNVLVGDATVLDFAQGLAFSVAGIHFQGLQNDGDKLYKFDGAEYATFPSLLAANFIAPDDDVTLELILFTLDGKANDGFGGVFAKLAGVAFDDDENPTSGAIEYDCFGVLDITTPPNRGFGSNITRQVSGGLVGHLELFASAVVANDVHDADPLTGGAASRGARKRPTHGWLVQTIAAGGRFNDGNAPPSVNPLMTGAAAWSRPLSQGTFPFTPMAGDVPSLHAGPPPFKRQRAAVARAAHEGGTPGAGSMAGSKTRRSPARATPQRGRRGLRGRQPLARWGLFLAAFGLLHAAIVIGGPGLAELATAATARASGWILGWLGLGGEVVGSRVFSKAFPVDIIFECTAVYPMAMFTAAVLAFPAGWRAQALGLLLGLPALAAINLVRVVSLVWLGHVHPAWFGAAHLLVWQSLIIVCTVLVWIAWVDTLARSEEALGA